MRDQMLDYVKKDWVCLIFLVGFLWLRGMVARSPTKSDNPALNFSDCSKSKICGTFMSRGGTHGSKTDRRQQKWTQISLLRYNFSAWDEICFYTQKWPGFIFPLAFCVWEVFKHAPQRDIQSSIQFHETLSEQTEVNVKRRGILPDLRPPVIIKFSSLLRKNLKTLSCGRLTN